MKAIEIRCDDELREIDRYIADNDIEFDSPIKWNDEEAYLVRDDGETCIVMTAWSTWRIPSTDIRHSAPR